MNASSRVSSSTSEDPRDGSLRRLAVDPVAPTPAASSRNT